MKTNTSFQHKNGFLPKMTMNVQKHVQKIVYIHSEENIQYILSLHKQEKKNVQNNISSPSISKQQQQTTYVSDKLYSWCSTNVS